MKTETHYCKCMNFILNLFCLPQHQPTRREQNNISFHVYSYIVTNVFDEEMKIGTYENATIFERAQTGWWASTKREGLFNQATIGFNLTEESLHMQNTFGSCTLAQCKNWLRPFKLIRFPFIDFAQCRLYRLLYFASLAKQSNLLRFVFSSHILVQVEIQHHSKWFDFFDSTYYIYVNFWCNSLEARISTWLANIDGLLWLYWKG